MAFLSKWWRAAAIVITAVLVSACASSPYLPLHPAVLEDARSLDVYVDVEQDNLEPTINKMKMGVPLVGVIGKAIVESTRLANARRAQEPVRAELADYDVNSLFVEEAARAFEDVRLRESARVDTAFENLDIRYLELAGKSEAELVLFLTTAYVLSPRMDTLQLLVRAMAFPNTPGLERYREPGRRESWEEIADLEHAVYLNDFQADVDLAGASSPGADAVTLWAENGGERIRQALELAAERVMSMVVLDMNASRRASSDSAQAGNGERARTQVVLKTEQGNIYRYANGTLYSRLRLPRKAEVDRSSDSVTGPE